MWGTTRSEKSRMRMNTRDFGIRLSTPSGANSWHRATSWCISSSYRLNAVAWSGAVANSAARAYAPTNAMLVPLPAIGHAQKAASPSSAARPPDHVFIRIRQSRSK